MYLITGVFAYTKQSFHLAGLQPIPVLPTEIRSTQDLIPGRANCFANKTITFTVPSCLYMKKNIQ